MEQKAADKLVGGQGHQLLSVMVLRVPPAEADSVVLQTDQAMIGDRYPMGVAAQIVQHLLRSAKGGLSVHHPFGTSQGSEIGGEAFGLRERSEGGEELEAPLCKRLLQQG